MNPERRFSISDFWRGDFRFWISDSQTIPRAINWEFNGIWCGDSDLQFRIPMPVVQPGRFPFDLGFDFDCDLNLKKRSEFDFKLYSYLVLILVIF